MALVLIKEDGTGKVDANSYADATDSDAYHEGQLWANTWTSAGADDKEKALVMATRVIDAEYQFNGTRVSDGQALQWPRLNCPDPDKPSALSGILLGTYDNFVPFNVIPKSVVAATCEMARELLASARTDSPIGEGLHSKAFSTTTRNPDGSGETDSQTEVYDKTDTRPIISRIAQALLGKFGSVIGGPSGSVKLVRV
jgi:hypothetical protein